MGDGMPRRECEQQRLIATAWSERVSSARLVRIALGLKLLASVGCMAEVDFGYPPGWPVRDGGAAGDAGRPRDAAADSATRPDAGAGTTSFSARVVDSTAPDMTLAGVRVSVLDDVTGLPLRPPVEAVSDARGRVRFSVARGTRFAVRASGTATHSDTYSFHYEADLRDARIRAGSNNVAVLLPLLTEYEARWDRAPVVGGVFWKTPNMPNYEPVGCAQIEAIGAETASLDLRYFADNLPSPPQNWPAAWGTNPTNGRFFIANMLPGQHTLQAKLPDGLVLGSTALAVFARSAASTLVNGQPANLFIVDLYIDAAAGSANPTPADCSARQHCSVQPELCLPPPADAGSGPQDGGPAEADAAPAPDAGPGGVYDAATPSLACGVSSCEGITFSSVSVQPCCVPDELGQATRGCGLMADDVKRAIPDTPFTGCQPRDLPYATLSSHCGALLDAIESEGDHQNGALDMRSGSRVAVYEGCCLPEGECGADVSVPRGAASELNLHLGCVSVRRLTDLFGVLVPTEYWPAELSARCDPATGSATSGP